MQRWKQQQDHRIRIVFYFLLIIFNIPIDKLKARDSETFEKLYREFSVPLFNFLLIKTKGNWAAAEDILSETFYSAFYSAPRIKNTINIRGWLMRIAVRRFKDYLKKEYRQRNKMDKLKQKNQQMVDNCEEEIPREEKIVLFKLALKNLKEEYQRVIFFKYTEKKTQKEIARIMNKSRSAVEGLLFRAREALKKEMMHLVNRHM